MLNKIINWAQSDDAIRTMLLVGSRARNAERVDAFSDFDLALFVTDPQKYITDDGWMRGIDEVWVYIPEKVCVDGKDYPTRLVIFKDGLKVDFAFYSIDVIKKLTQQKELPAQYSLGYKILLDKDNLTTGMKAPIFKIPASQKPSQQEFENLVNEFFFETYHVAKHLCRNDLWHAKFRDWTTKELLLRMIEWHEKAMHGWDLDTCQHGKRMQEWAGKETLDALSNCFAHFDAGDSWKALIVTINLFRRLAMDTAEHLGYNYPMGADKNITMFVQKVMEQKLPRSFTFTPITENNLPLLQPLLYRWFQMPHIEQWWPVPTKNEDFFNSFLKRIRSGTKPYLVVYNDLPIGYIQCYSADSTTSPWLPKLPDNLVGIDQFIGEPDYLGKVIGTLFIKDFVKELIEKDNTLTIIVDPDPTNIAAIRCYEKVGFKRLGEYQAPWGPALVMTYQVTSSAGSPSRL